MSYALADSSTMLRRNLLHARRYPGLTISAIGMPLIFLLLFNYVFGHPLGAGIGSGHYIDYLAPGIILMTATSGAVGTAIGINTDVTEGIVDRFRTMDVSRGAYLIGHVVGNVLQTLLTIAIITGVAVAIGFRPDATPLEWLAAAGLLFLLVLALTWFSAALGLIADRPETASNLPLPLTLLPLLSSAIVPTATMPVGLRQFAEYQPFTPLIETLRGLLLGGPIGAKGWVAVAWCVGLTVVGYLWAHRVFYRAAR